MASGFANPLAATMASTVTPNCPAMYDSVSPCWMVYVCSPIGAVVVVAAPGLPADGLAGTSWLVALGTTLLAWLALTVRGLFGAGVRA